MRILKNQKNDKKHLWVVENDEELELVLDLWNRTFHRQPLGLFKMLTVSVLNAKDPEVIALKKPFPNAVAFVWREKK